MNIHYIAFIRLPTEKAHGAQIMKTCEAFAREGARVELVVPGRQTHIYEDPFDYYDVQRNFKITKLNTPDLVSFGSIGFLLSVLWFSQAVKWRKGFWNADVIYSRDASVLLLCLLLGRKLVYEAHTKPTVVSKLVAKRAHRVIAISDGLKDVYIKCGIDSKNITVAHDAIDPEPFRKQYNQNEAKELLGIPLDKKIALYVGRIDSAKGADTFAAASEYVPDGWQCVLIGHGPLKEQLDQQYPKALFLPETPYKDLARVLVVGDVLVLPNSAKDENAAIYTSPLKAFAYLASGKPIVASRVPALKSILGDRARYFAADSPEACARQVVSAVSIPQIPLLHTWTHRARSILHSL